MATSKGRESNPGKSQPKEGSRPKKPSARKASAGKAQPRKQPTSTGKSDTDLTTFLTKKEFDGGVYKTRESSELPGASIGMPFPGRHHGDADAGGAHRESYTGGRAESILGSDERDRVHDTSIFPYSAICHIEMTAKTRHTFQGTAWFAAPNMLMTAGHNVFMHDYGGYVSDITIFPGRNGRSADGILAVDWSTTKSWAVYRSDLLDIGVIWINEKVDCGHLGYDEYTDDKLSRMSTAVVGYPGDKEYGTMWIDDEKRFVRVYPQQLKYEFDTYAGQSGAPVMVNFGEEKFKAVGIHNYGSVGENLATRIDTGVAKLIDKWKQNRNP